MPETIDLLVRESVADVEDPEVAKILGKWKRKALQRERQIAVRDAAMLRDRRERLSSGTGRSRSAS